jgi:hypothetical protein
MSVLFAPNSHVPHWSESVVLQPNSIPISYIRKSFGILETFLTEDVFRSVRSLVRRRLGFLRFAARFIDRSPGGPTVSIAFWSKFCPVDFNLDLAACVTFCPSMTSYARLRPVFKASRPTVLAPLFNKGTADLNRLPNILPSPCPL